MLDCKFDKYFPKVLVEKQDNSGQALINFLNENICEWKKEIIEMKYLKNPDRTGNKFLDDLGDYVEAGIFPGDSETLKRQKIQTAVATHKLRGTWEDNVKIIIDRITGKDSSLVKADGGDDAILLGDGTEDDTFYWMTLGGDGIDDELGIYLSGSTQVEIAGVVYIDLGYTIDDLLYPDDSVVPGDGTVSGTTYESTIGTDGIDSELGMYIPGDGTSSIDDILDEIVLNISEVVPAYFRVFLGYTDADGDFIILREVE
jgi:hypothetical protein